MEDMSKVIELSVLDSLRFKEVLSHKLDPLEARSAVQCLRDILNNDSTWKIWEPISERICLLTETATNVNKKCAESYSGMKDPTSCSTG